ERLLSIISSPPLRWIVCPFRESANRIVSPDWAAPISARSDPAPALAALVTVQVLRTTRPSSTSSSDRATRRGRRRADAVRPERGCPELPDPRMNMRRFMANLLSQTKDERSPGDDRPDHRTEAILGFRSQRSEIQRSSERAALAEATPPI